jgi:hypothetical protein
VQKISQLNAGFVIELKTILCIILSADMRCDWQVFKPTMLLTALFRALAKGCSFACFYGRKSCNFD